MFVCAYECLSLASKEGFIAPHFPRTQLSGALSYLGHKGTCKEVCKWAARTWKWKLGSLCSQCFSLCRLPGLFTFALHTILTSLILYILRPWGSHLKQQRDGQHKNTRGEGRNKIMLWQANWKSTTMCSQSPTHSDSGSIITFMVSLILRMSVQEITVNIQAYMLKEARRYVIEF